MGCEREAAGQVRSVRGRVEEQVQAGVVTRKLAREPVV